MIHTNKNRQIQTTPSYRYLIYILLIVIFLALCINLEKIIKNQVNKITSDVNTFIIEIEGLMKRYEISKITTVPQID